MGRTIAINTATPANPASSDLALPTLPPSSQSSYPQAWLGNELSAGLSSVLRSNAGPRWLAGLGPSALDFNQDGGQLVEDLASEKTQPADSCPQPVAGCRVQVRCPAGCLGTSRPAAE